MHVNGIQIRMGRLNVRAILEFLPSRIIIEAIHRLGFRRYFGSQIKPLCGFMRNCFRRIIFLILIPHHKPWRCRLLPPSLLKRREKSHHQGEGGHAFDILSYFHLVSLFVNSFFNHQFLERALAAPEAARPYRLKWRATRARVGAEPPPRVAQCPHTSQTPPGVPPSCSGSSMPPTKTVLLTLRGVFSVPEELRLYCVVMVSV